MAYNNKLYRAYSGHHFYLHCIPETKLCSLNHWNDPDLILHVLCSKTVKLVCRKIVSTCHPPFMFVYCCVELMLHGQLHPPVLLSTSFLERTAQLLRFCCN